MTRKRSEPDFELSTNRIEALSDGVFAIALTLLVLEIHIPEFHGDPTSERLGGGLLSLWPKFFSYVVSFVTLGVYWVAHHLQFVSIQKANRTLLWINILFLLTIGLVPFSTALVGSYFDQPVAVILYGANMIVIGLTLYLHWTYATNGHRLVIPTLSPQLITRVKHVILMGPWVYLAAIAIAFFDTRISLALFLLVNLIYVVPGGIHLHLKHSAKPQT